MGEGGALKQKREAGALLAGGGEGRRVARGWGRMDRIETKDEATVSAPSEEGAPDLKKKQAAAAAAAAARRQQQRQRRERRGGILK